MSLILAYKNRGLSKDITINDVNGLPITPGVHDKVRVTIYREGEVEVFTVTSGTPTASGSSITTGAANRLRLDASDLSFASGVYTMAVEYYDNADSAEWKLVEKQCFVLEATS